MKNLIYLSVGYIWFGLVSYAPGEPSTLRQARSYSGFFVPGGWLAGPSWREAVANTREGVKA